MKKFINWLGENPGAIIAAACWLFLLLSAAGVFHNIYQANVAAAPWGWHLFGWFFTLVAVLWLVGILEDLNFTSKSPAANAILLVLIIAISLAGFTGFFTNG